MRFGYWRYLKPILASVVLLGSSAAVVAQVDRLYQQGSQQLLNGELDSAQRLFNEGLSVAKVKRDSLYIGRFYYGLGVVLHRQQAFEEALTHYHKSLQFIRADQYPDELGKTYTNIGALYAQQKDFDRAKQYLEEALAIITSKNVQQLQVMTNLAALYLDQGELEDARPLILEAIAVAKTLDQPYIESVLYTNLSKLYTETKQWKQAIAASKRALHIRDSIRQGSLVAPRTNIGYAHENLGMLDTAMKYYHAALKDATGSELLGVLRNLKRIARKTGNLRQALQYYDRYDEVKDSIAAQDHQAQVAELTEKYESEQKQAEIDYLQAESKLQEGLITRQRMLMGVSLALLILFAVLVYLWVRQTKTRQALDKSKMQQRLLLTQLNPHFIFNALQSVQHYIFKNQPESAMGYLSSFAKLIRSVLEHSDQDTIPLEEEVDMIRNYLYLQRLGHQNGFSYAVKPDRLPPALDGAHIPVMLVQPFVENAVIHGMRGLTAGKIAVDFEHVENTVTITICDNGKGIRSSGNHHANALHRSMAREITDKRIREFNKVNKQKITLQIGSCEDNPEFPGTKVVLQVPIRL